MEAEFIDNQNEGDNFQICEVCGNRMLERGCKIRCGRCGYFRSCSDLF